MARKIETKNSPKDFYASDTIPSEERASYYYALDKNTSAADIQKVEMLSYINQCFDAIKENQTDKHLAEILKLNVSTVSRIRRYRINHFKLDNLWSILHIAFEILKEASLTGQDVVKLYQSNNQFKPEQLSY